MKKSNNSIAEDQELSGFFDELKTEEAKQPVPDFDSLIVDAPVKHSTVPFWRYAAAIGLLLIGLATYQWGFDTQGSEPDITEITISYEYPSPDEVREADEFELPGMDQWQSETDILLTGL